jgi:NADH-quinone oxidoreductase subunit N
MMEWNLIIPELYYLLTAGVFFALALLPRPKPRRDYYLALILASVGVIVSLASVKVQGTVFFQAYRVDLFSQVFKSILAMGLFLVVCICSELTGIDKNRHPEFYLLLSICTLAMMMLVSAVELLTIYLSLELSSYSLYILVPLRRGTDIDLEAGLKYFLFGASVSAIMLFGLAILYGVTHTTYVAELIHILPGMLDRPMAFIGLLFTLCGFFFKLAVFPFHFWAPGAYQGAANQVTAYIATASKVAAVAVLMRVVASSCGSSAYLVYVLVTLSIASMTVGNLVAIVQKDFKRLLAYSTIAHAGYILIGILSMSPSGYSSAIFYAAAYLIMKFTCFLVLVKVAYDGSNLMIAQLAGLHHRSPLLAMALLVSVFSLAGIPPTIGFTGKFLVFVSAMREGYFVLVLIAMINVAISLYYYLLIVKAAYLLKADEELCPIPVSLTTKVFATVLATGIIVFGVFPHHLLELARAAARTLM